VSVMQDFTIRDFKALCDLLTEKKIMPRAEAEAFAHAMTDIRESAMEIYDEYLPRLMEQLRTGNGDVEDTIWDIREACRHIDYHLKDAKLPPGS
jgi:hypothetical protein